MPRYVTESRLPQGTNSPLERLDDDVDGTVLEADRREGVQWLYSFISTDRSRLFCFYDGPSPEAVRRTAGRYRMPVDDVVEVQFLDVVRRRA